MTISTTSNTTIAQGNGLTTSFDFPFPVPLASELLVYYTAVGGSPVLLTPSQYSTTGIGTAVGGSVTYPLTGSPIPTGASLTIQRIVPYQQLTDLVNQSGYYPNVVENALDYLTMQTQQLAQGEQLTLQVPLESALSNLVLPNKATRSLGIVGFDALGNAIIYPLPATVGAGNMTAEVGSNGHPGFKVGTDFVIGMPSILTLSKAYGSVANVFTAWDGTYQERDSYTISGNQIIYGSWVNGSFVTGTWPAGISNVDVVGGTTLSNSIPASGSVTDDSVASVANISSDKLLYTPGWVAGAPRILTKKFDDAPNILDCQIGGAVGTGNDDTAAFNRAMSAGVKVNIPAGTFHIGNVVGNGSLVGSGADQTTILATVATGDAIKWNGLGQLIYNGQMTGPRFRGFSMGTTVTRTGGALLAIDPSIGEISYCLFDDLIFRGGYDQLDWRAVSHSVGSALKFINYSNNGTIVANPNEPDSGDSVLMGCLWNCGVPTGLRVGILHKSSGGLRVVSPKFLGGMSHYFMAADLPTKNIANLSIEGGSSENCEGNAFTFTRHSGTFSWGSIRVKGVQFGLNVTDILAADPSGFISDMHVVGNTFSQLSNNGVAVSVDHFDGFHAVGNKGGGSGGTSTGFAIGPGMTNWRLDANQFPGVAVPYSIGAPANTGMIDGKQQGQVAVTTSSAESAFWAGIVAVTFPVPYPLGYIPTVDAFVDPGAPSGGFSCRVGSKTNTGFTLNAIGQTQNASVVVNWSSK